MKAETMQSLTDLDAEAILLNAMSQCRCKAVENHSYFWAIDYSLPVLGEEDSVSLRCTEENWIKPLP
jgi:hypothetical protein